VQSPQRAFSSIITIVAEQYALRNSPHRSHGVVAEEELVYLHGIFNNTMAELFDTMQQRVLGANSMQ
jgi:hypothetical protein